MGWQKLLLAIGGAGVTLAGARVCQHQLSLPCPWCDFFTLESLDTSWASCPGSRQFPGHTALRTARIQISCETAVTGGVSVESGECCTLREQTAPELVMDLHCREKQAHLQLGLQTGREGREEELALNPWEPLAPLVHSSHPSCQEDIRVPGEHPGMQHPTSNVRTKTLIRGMFSGYSKDR